jgi:hypothetical protein
MWRFWDEFGIADAKMLGYWDADCPVRTGREDVLATAYRKAGKSLIALARWPQKTGRPSVFIRPGPAPTVDGKLSPEEWDGATKLTNLTAFQGDTPATQQTEAHLTFDDTHLYVGFRCVQSGPLRAEATARDAATWEDDAVEFFVQPDPAQSRYLQFIGNSRGVLADTQNMDLAWNGEWEYRATVSEGYWEGELSIRFASLGMEAPRQGAQIGFNICRDQQQPTRQSSTWAPVQTSFHEPANFGRLVCSTEEPVTRQEPQGPEGEGVTNVSLQVDWRALGLDARKTRLVAPPILHFQGPRTFAPDDEIPVAPGKGWLLVASPR